MIPESGAPLTMIRIRNPITGISLESRIQDFLGYPCMKWLCWRGKGTREGRKPLDVCVGWQPRPQGFSLKNGWAQSEPLGRGCVGRSASSPVSSDHFFCTLRDSFQGGKTFCASFCASLTAGSRRAFLCVDWVDCVCLLLEFWVKCKRLLPVKHFYLTYLLFFVAWKLLWIQNNQC